MTSATDPAAATHPSSDGNIRVEEFHGDRGPKYRTFKNHLLSKFEASNFSPKNQLLYLSSRCFGAASKFIRQFTDKTYPRFNPQPIQEVLKAFDQRY